MRQKLTILTVSLLLLVSMVVPVAIFAVNPVVTITVTAQVISITNSKATWAIGTIAESAIIYFSVDNLQDNDYSLVTNTSNVAVDVELQGTTIEGGAYDWTLAAASANQTYQLYANSTNSTGAYDIEIKSAAAYTDLIADLGINCTYMWSANFTAPTAFNPVDDGTQKSGTITLVATKHI